MLRNLKILRMKNGMTQQQLALAVGVSQQSINKYENHNIEPDINTLIALADFFHTSVDYLIDRPSSSEEPQFSARLNGDEQRLLDGYRALTEKEKESIRLILENYNR